MTMETGNVRGMIEETSERARKTLEALGDRGLSRVNAIRERGEMLIQEFEGRLKEIRSNVDVYRNLGIVPRRDFETVVQRLDAVEAGLTEMAEKNRDRKDSPVAPKKAAPAKE